MMIFFLTRVYFGSGNCSLPETAQLPCASTLQCAQNRAHGKGPFCRVLPKRHTAKLLHTANSYFAVCQLRHSAKQNICRVLFVFAVCIVFSTRQSFSKKVDFTLPTFFGIHVLYMVLYANIWYFFSLFSTFSHLISLNTFVGIKSNLNCKQFE